MQHFITRSSCKHISNTPYALKSHVGPMILNTGQSRVGTWDHTTFTISGSILSVNDSHPACCGFNPGQHLGWIAGYIFGTHLH